MRAALSDVVEALDAFAPPGLAEPWDRPGLQVGDPGAPIRSVLVALDPSPRAVDEAIRRKAQLLVTHHPLLLTPPASIDLSTPQGALLGKALSGGVAVFACHTNLDRAAGGVNDALAERLGLRDVGPLTAGEAQVKLVVTVPVGYEPRVRAALGSAGGGRIGRYAGCTFAVRGTGTFVPLEGARPFAGSLGALETAEETRLETVVPRSRLQSALGALAAAHPYEEPAVDVYPVEAPSTLGSLGRVGRLERPRPLGAWAREVCGALCIDGARLSGDPDTVVEVAAVCGGSGASLWREAARAGAQVLVTGDVKYHTALEAAERGLSLLDVGHGPSEAVAVEVLASALRDWVGHTGLGVEIDVFHEVDPFVWLPA